MRFVLKLSNIKLLKISALLIVLLASATSFTQNLDCSKFKTGHFRYLNEDYADLLTIRTDSSQIDSYSDSSNFQATSHISWSLDCRYTFEYYKVNDVKFESLVGTKYTVQITRIKGDTITCQKVIGDTLHEKMLMLKVKDL